MIQSLPCQYIGFHLSSDLSFLTLKGAGLQYIDSHEYSWNSRDRKDDLCLIQYCIDGEGALEMDGSLYPIRQGEAFVVNIPDENHYFLPPHSSHWEVLYLEFSKECLSLIRKIYQHTGPVLHLASVPGLVDQMFSIYKKALENKFATFFENTKTAYNLWMDLTSYAVACSESKLSRLDVAKAYLDNNYYMQDLNLDLVAEHVGMCKYHMCKMFHEKYGITPGKYLKELRISQACRLLTTHSNYTMQEIAQIVGYSNNNYFGKVFKAVKGVTPEQFKKQSVHYDFVRAVYETPRQIHI